jgi:PAS domain S-box-containing protein
MGRLFQPGMIPAIADRIGVGSYDCDLRTRRVSLSPSMRRMAGVSSASPLTSEQFLALIHSDERAAVEALFHPSDGQSVTTSFCRFLRPSGDVRHTMFRAEGIRAADGAIVRVVGLVFDTTNSHDVFMGVAAAADDPVQFAAALHQASVALCLVEDMRVADVNLAFTDLTGYTRAEALGRPATDVGIGDPFRREEFADELRRGAPIAGRVVRCLRKDLRTHLVLMSAEPIVLAGRPSWLVALIDSSVKIESDAGSDPGELDQDEISERERADRAVQALRESQEQFRELAETHGDGVVLVEGHELVHANTKFAAMLGYEPADLVGRPLASFLEPGRLDLHGRDNGVEEPIVLLAQRRDGTTFPAEWSPRSVRVGGREYQVATVRDVTRRERLDRLRRALVAGTAGVAGSEFFDALVKHLAAALQVGTAWIAEYVGEPAHTIRTISLWRQDRHGEAFDRALAGTPCEQVRQHGAHFVGRQLAEAFPGDDLVASLQAQSYFGVPLFDSGGQPLGVLAVVDDRPMDRTDEREDTLTIFAARASVELQRLLVEQEIRRLNVELEQRVVDRTARLEAANHELEAFSYSVSHDLRAPLRHISGFADLLRAEASVGLSEAGHEHLTEIAAATGRMDLLITQLLDFSRVARAELHTDMVDLSALATSVRRELEPDAAGRDVTWHIANVAPVWGDPILLRQVLANLLGNALKYTGKRPAATIEFGQETGAHSGEVVCYVRDNGVGFDMRYAHLLFGVFQRLHPTSEFEGTGVGLANVHRIVARLGGRVWAEGRVGEGATFFFALPAAPDDTEAA